MKIVKVSCIFLATFAKGWVPFSQIPSSSRLLTTRFMSKEEEMGLNELQTLLRDAARRQDFMEAGRLSDVLVRRIYPGDLTEEEFQQKRYRMSWLGLGTAPWLEDRLDALNFTFPTTIQINAMEAMNSILNVPEDIFTTTTLEERLALDSKDMGIVISGTTGSGKTIAYLAPLLSAMSDSFFIRQRLRVGAEERILGDKTSDFVARIMAVTSPEVRSRSSNSNRQGGIATGAALSSLGRSGTDVTKPLVLIVVPTKELGSQISILLYQLVGGSIRKKSAAFQGKASMFKYKGPKGVKIGCVLDDEDAQEGLKLQTDIAVTTPQYLTKLLQDGDIDPSKLRVVVYDEADLALEQTNPNDLELLFNDNLEEREFSRVTFLVGASVTESLGNLAVSSRVLPEGKSYIATANTFAPLCSGTAVTEKSILASEESTIASLKDLDVCMDPGLKHSRVVTSANTRLLTLTKLLRKELDAYEEADKDEKVALQRPRVVVFFPTEEEARAAIEPIRDALWNKHQVCVLLPKTGFDPTRIMEEFVDGKTNLMIATPNSVRGLDFPALTHVYAMYLPFDDPREYVHLAGRVGRVGQLGSTKGTGGHVVAILKEEEAGKMDELAKLLNFQFTDIEVDDEFISVSADDDEESMDMERIRRYLEDTLNLVTMDQSLSSDIMTSSDSGSSMDDDNQGESTDMDLNSFE